MLKKILRAVTLVLVLTLFASLLPSTISTAASSATQTEAQRISALVKSTYKKALKRAGRRSFHGWCGAAVDWQLRVLGITTKVVGANGCDQFDRYRREEFTSGGYTIDAYPASKYDLREAIDAITDNGERPAYNLLVGFQRTNTSAGRKYGHATFVYAILDGVVYFTESFGLTINGTYYAEGKCITCSVDDFVKYYKRWTTLDGVIHFTQQTYSDECEYLNAYLYASVTQETTLYSQPCTPDVDDSSVEQRQLQPGERLNVVGMYLNTQGEYWYEVDDAQIGYVRAADTEMLSMRYDDVAVSGVKAPTVITEGSSFNIKGSVTAKYAGIISVRAQVYAAGEDGITHVMTTNAAVKDNDYSLYKSTVGKRLSFKRLAVGSYHYELAAVVKNHYYADGDLQTDWQTIKLWLTDFRVVEKKGETANLTFDPCGGTASLNSAEMDLGQPLEVLPTAEREGYIFDGWYTADGELVDEEYVLEGKMTLYAHWILDEEVTGWFWEDDQLYYVENGIRPEGFFQVDGLTYHHNVNCLIDTGWTNIDGEAYFFNVNGSMVTGWLPTEAGIYYMGVDGTKTIGWATIGNDRYYFDEDGLMVTGTLMIDGVKYVFGENGALVHLKDIGVANVSGNEMHTCQIGRGSVYAE